MARKGGWRRRGAKGRFHYVNARGNRITDPDRLERIEADFATVCDRVGVQAQLGRLNPTVEKRESLGDYYASDAVERRVQDVYARDFELFGYPLRPPI